MLDLAARDGVALADPAVMDASMRRTIDLEIGRGGSPTERIERIRSWLHEGAHPFAHDPALTTDVLTAFKTRRGGCMTHAILFVTIARYLGVPAYYVHARTAHQFAERGDELIAMTHVAIGYDDAAIDHVVDIWTPLADFRIARYERIDDSAALALYYSNRAVGDLTSGHLAQAEKLLRFLSRPAWGGAEVYNNLAAILLRQKRFDDALAVARVAIARFPDFKPLYTNGYLAALGTGNEPLAETFASRGRDLLDNDPIFLVARGISEYERGHYAKSAKAFERARAAKHHSSIIHAWLVRAYVAAGDSRSNSAFEEAWQTTPNDPRLERLAHEHPSLSSGTH
jgi:tetratricopeptide (TPR) repeat protein